MKLLLTLSYYLDILSIGILINIFLDMYPRVFARKICTYSVIDWLTTGRTQFQASTNYFLDALTLQALFDE
jgi:hypothetical protein